MGKLFHTCVVLGLWACGLTLPYAQAGPSPETGIISTAALEGAGYGKFWDAHLHLSADDGLASFHLLDENLYLVTGNGDIYAVEADTGLLRWAMPLETSLSGDRPPTHVQTATDDGPVVFTTPMRIHIFDRYNGDRIRRLRLPFAAAGPAVADATSMYLGSVDGELYALWWSSDLCLTAPVRWRALVNGVVVSQPALKFDGQLYFASTNGLVYCVNAQDKTVGWSFHIGGAVTSGIVVDESGVYVSSLDHNLYVLDPVSGAQLRSYQLPGPLFDPPVVAQHTLYQYCQGAGVYAFDTDTRQLLWTKPEIRRFVARAAETLVLLTESGDLCITDNDTGTVRGYLNLPEAVLVASNPRDANLYVVSPDGRILCAKPLGFPYLRREDVAAARAGLHRSPEAGRNAANPSQLRTPELGGRSSPGVDDPLRSKGTR